MKHTVILSALSLTILAGSACTQVKKDPLSDGPFISVPFADGVENVKEIKLSEIAEKVALVRLATPDSALVARPKLNALTYLQGKIYIPCTVGLLSFGEDGKFIKSISRRGQGPGEYSGLRYVVADATTGHLYLMDHGKVVTYTPNGDFLRENRMPFAWQFAVMQDSLFVSYLYNNTGRKEDRLLLTDAKADTLRRFPQPDKFEMPGGMNWYYVNDKEYYLYNYKGEVCCRDYYCDTIYTVTPDSLLPRLVLQMGKYALPKDFRLEPKMMTPEADQALDKAKGYFRPTVWESDRFLIMPYTSWNLTDKEEIPQLMIYDKESRTCTRAQDGVLTNDMYGSLPFYPIARVADNVLLAYWEAADLLDKVEQDPSLAELPELKGLKEDDNPILMLVYLKK